MGSVSPQAGAALQENPTGGSLHKVETHILILAGIWSVITVVSATPYPLFVTVTVYNISDPGIDLGLKVPFTGSEETVTDLKKVMIGDSETVLVSSVTVPFRARILPDMVAPVFTVMLVSARIFPANAVFVPSVAELPTCQNTLLL